MLEESLILSISEWATSRILYLQFIFYGHYQSHLRWCLPQAEAELWIFWEQLACQEKEREAEENMGWEDLSKAKS